ncbi:hypothetical protein AYK26_06990 [Euryarchaeota archaeon SM23-78]|nr:MAG: hypothetical protein AYK26_06990 [Euryarchaeota archaeon SM23-78]
MSANLIDRAVRAAANTIGLITAPFKKDGFVVVKSAMLGVDDDSNWTTNFFKNTFENIIKPPFQAWFDIVNVPSSFTPDAAFQMSKTFIPAAIGVTATIQGVDTVLQALPLGFDTSGFGMFGEKVFSRLGLSAATAATFQSPVRVGLFRNLDYYYNEKFRSQKLKEAQAYDGVRYREFLTESEWAAFEGNIDLPKPIEEMTPEEIASWAATASQAVDAVESTNTGRFMDAMRWLGYRDDDMLLQDRASKHAPNLTMLRQMAMRGFFDAKFMARACFKGGFDNWAIKPTLNFLAYMAQEGVWVGYREAAQMAFRKGLIDEAELRTILKRIHVPSMLVEPIIVTQKAMMIHSERELTMTQIINAYLKGVYTRNECLIELKNLGYTEELAEILIKSKEATSQPLSRLPTLAQFSRAFREGIISEADFRAYLEKRGYDNKYIDMLVAIELAKFPVAKPIVTMSTLGRAFREGVISDVVLKQRLAGLGYSFEESDWIKLLYVSQASIPSASLSKSEILKAWSLNFIDVHDATDRLVSMGYSLEDIDLLFKLYAPEVADDVKYISESVCYKLWGAGLVSESWVKRRLLLFGYSEGDADLLITFNKPSAIT